MKIGRYFLGGILLMTSVSWAEVIAENLPEIKIGTIGVETGLSPDIWGDEPDAEDVLQQIKESAEVDLNEAEKEILRRILMTDVGGVSSLEKKGESYLTERVNALTAQGMFDEALTLLDKVSDRGLSNELKQLKSEVLFVMGRVEEACAENYMETFKDKEVFIRAVCADVIGVPPASALAYEVYRESGKDNYSFLNAAGEVLYRDMDTKIPAGEPSVWEMPILARAFGTDVFKNKLPKKHLWVLLNQEQIPHEVRLAAKNTLMRKEKAQADGKILTHLIQMAMERTKLEDSLKGRNAE